MITVTITVVENNGFDVEVRGNGNSATEKEVKVGEAIVELMSRFLKKEHNAKPTGPIINVTIPQQNKSN